LRRGGDVEEEVKEQEKALPPNIEISFPST
jgi:hypothetical protein